MVGSVLPVVSSVDTVLHALGQRRTVAVRMPSVLSTLALVASSDLVATTYERIVPIFGKSLVTYALPFELPPLELHLMWHPRQNADYFHRWLRELLLTHAAGSTRQVRRAENR